MVKIPFTLYPGYVVVTHDVKEFDRLCRQWMGETCPTDDEDGWTIGTPDQEYLVWARTLPALVHELNHVALDVFAYVGIDPGGSEGEPFCYLMQHLFEEAVKVNPSWWPRRRR